jgi:guanylate kinase
MNSKKDSMKEAQKHQNNSKSDSQQDFYDIKIVNDDIETAKEELIKILKTNYALRK